jgi:hypothetical protein
LYEGESFISVIAKATCFSLRITNFISSGTGHVVACGEHFRPSASVLVGTIMSIGAPLSGSARARLNVNLELSRSGNGVRNGFRRPDGRRGSGQFAESALDTLYVARNRG